MNSDSPWTYSTCHPRISRAAVHLWRTRLDQPESVVRDLGNFLSREELRRADRYLSDFSRQCFMVGRGWLRTMLGRYLGLDPRAFDFCYGPYGKPELAEISKIHNRQSNLTGSLRFNLSHSQNIAVLAVAIDRYVGIDVEQIRSVVEMDGIVTQLLSSAERSEFDQLPVSQRKSAFFRCWTQKEAYLKALGDGLTVPLQNIEVSIGTEAPPKLRRVLGRPKEASRWILKDVQPSPGYLGALAVEGCDWQLHCFNCPNHMPSAT